MVFIFCKKTNNYNKYISPLDLILYSFFCKMNANIMRKGKTLKKSSLFIFIFVYLQHNN